MFLSDSASFYHMLIELGLWMCLPYKMVRTVVCIFFSSCQILWPSINSVELEMLTGKKGMQGSKLKINTNKYNNSRKTAKEILSKSEFQSEIELFLQEWLKPREETLSYPSPV